MNMQLRTSGVAGFYGQPINVFSSESSAHYRATKPDLRSKFYQHLRRWRFDTMLESSVDKAVGHHDFREIVGLGELVVPMIISEIRTKPDSLMIALQMITGTNPVQDRHRGRMAEMASDWIDWYQRKV